MRTSRGPRLLDALFCTALALPLAAGAALAQQPPKPPVKDETKQKEEQKKKEDEAKQREEEAKKLAAAVAEQKKTAQVNWDMLGLGEPAFRETQHVLLYAPKSHEKKLAEAGQVLERFYTFAYQAVGFKPEAPPWPGKLAVYLFPVREQYNAFRRRVEKRKVEPEITCSFVLGDAPHVAASPPQSVGDVTIEGQAGEQLALAMLAKESAGIQVAPWIFKGFARATYHHVFPTSRTTIAERQQALDMVRKNRANVEPIFNERSDVLNLPALRASLADFLAYGPGNSKFPAFIVAFKPDKEKQERMRDTIKALHEVAIEPDMLKKTWHAWVLGGGR
jgi:hypothetical protein